MKKRTVELDRIHALFKDIISRKKYKILGVQHNINIGVMVSILNRIDNLAIPLQESIIDNGNLPIIPVHDEKDLA